MEEEFAMAMRQTLAAHTDRHNSQLKQREVEFSEALELAMEAKDTEQAALEVAMHRQEEKHAAAFQAQHEQYVANLCLQGRQQAQKISSALDGQIKEQFKQIELEKGVALVEQVKQADLEKDAALVEQADQISDAIKIALTAIENSDVRGLWCRYRLIHD
jgi:superoxide dismutase